ncbi:MAG: hypothetical protein ABI199_09785 [Bacteroidia bacterium]
MKKQVKLIFGLFLTTAILLNSGCATLFGTRTNNVVLYDAPADLTVTDNGVPVQTERVFSHGKEKSHYASQYSTIYSYYTTGLKLDKKIKHKLELTSAGKTGTIVLKSKVKGIFIVLDIFSTGPIGLFIDGFSKNWKALKPRRIDTPAIINGTKSRRAKRLEKDLEKSLKNK